jgi:hypothetical protein
MSLWIIGGLVLSHVAAFVAGALVYKANAKKAAAVVTAVGAVAAATK